jgi:Zn-dependent peptidase ImmA (M78 family)
VSLVTQKQRLASSPEVFARELLSRLNLRSAGDLTVLTDRLGLSVKEVDSDGFEGVLVCRADRRKGIIAIQHGIQEEGRKRFTICHEIAHFVLPGHGVDGCVCKSEDIESWRHGAPEYEIEANAFASELLLPYQELAPLVRKQKATIALAKDIARDFGSSLTAACLKCVDVTEEECAFVYSVAESIKWFRRNENFWHYIHSGRLAPESLAARLFKEVTREQDGAVPAKAWLEDERLRSDSTIWEDSIFFPSYNSAITILTIHKSLS